METKNCPFCGKEVKVTRGVYNAPFLFFECVNDNCGAVISFNNMIANLDPDKAYDNFNRRYSDESNG